MNCFSDLFDKELYMFRSDLLSIIRSVNTVYTAIGICRAKLAWQIPIALRLLIMDSRSVRNI